MSSTMVSNALARTLNTSKVSENAVTNLAEGNINTEYIIKSIQADDEELVQFLFSLGCYEGEVVTVISKLAENVVIAVKDARYSIDQELAEAIVV